VDYLLLTDGDRSVYERLAAGVPDETSRCHGTVDDLAGNEHVAAITLEAVRGMSADAPQRTIRAALCSERHRLLGPPQPLGRQRGV
jgi:hypothetical protein